MRVRAGVYDNGIHTFAFGLTSSIETVSISWCKQTEEMNVQRRTVRNS